MNDLSTPKLVGSTNFPTAVQGSARSALVPLLVLVILIAGFYIVTLRGGLSWGDDFAFYIHHAKNLLEGKPYSATGYIFNPSFPHVGPLQYPPGFPLMLVPVIALFGMNYTAMKVETILAFAAALFFIFMLFRDRLPYWWSILLIALIGLNPFFWGMRDDIASDLPFFMVACGTLWLIQWTYSSTKDDPHLALALPVGLAIYVASAMRPLGLMLIPALGVYDLLKARRVRPFPLIAIAVASLGAVLQMIVLGTDGRYAQLDFHPKWLGFSLLANVKDYRACWLNGYSHPISYGLFFAVVLVTVYGAWRSLHSGMRVYDLWAIFYFCVVVPYSVVVHRYLIPLVPILMLYLFIGLYALKDELSPRVARIVFACGAVLVVFSYGTSYVKAESGPIREGIFDPDFRALCSYIRLSTRPSSRFIFRKPRLLTLETGRAAAVYHQPEDPTDLWKFIDSIGASYIVVADVPNEEFNSDRTYLKRFVSAFPGRLLRVYQNRHYQVFRVAAANSP